MSVPLSLSDKIALISGGSRGIGAATVRMFAAAGAQVAFSYRRARVQAEALARECGATSCFAIASDLSTPDSARSLVADIELMTEEQWRSTMAINLDSVFGLVQAAVVQMQLQGPPPTDEDGPKGHIVLISSTSGQRGEAFHCDYSASKGALISMTKTLAAELASAGIYVNCVAPGWVDTDMSKGALEDPSSGEEIRHTIPMGRVGRPEEIAGPVLFLCTEHASFITGEIFNVNGGAVLVG